MFYLVFFFIFSSSSLLYIQSELLPISTFGWLSSLQRRVTYTPLLFLSCLPLFIVLGQPSNFKTSPRYWGPHRSNEGGSAFWNTRSRGHRLFKFVEEQGRDMHLNNEPLDVRCELYHRPPSAAHSPLVIARLPLSKKSPSCDALTFPT